MGLWGKGARLPLWRSLYLPLIYWVASAKEASCKRRDYIVWVCYPGM